MRILVDSSALIALAMIGELDMLKVIFEKVSVTNIVKEEVLRGDYPEKEVLEAAMKEWIEVINYEGDASELRKYGLWVGIGRSQSFTCSEVRGQTDTR
jgi:predicted nucleic acid-binding protein